MKSHNFSQNFKQLKSQKKKFDHKKKAVFQIEPLTGLKVIETAKLFSKVFCAQEPLTLHLNLEYNDFYPFALEFVHKAAKDSLSFIVTDEKNNVVGCILGEDLYNPFQSFGKYRRLLPIFMALKKLSEPFFQNRYKPGAILHLTVVAIDACAAGRGLYHKLVRTACAHSKMRGYHFNYSEFTNPKSEKLMTIIRNNKKINSIQLDKFVFKGKKPFQGLNRHISSYIFPTVTDPKIKLEGLYNFIISNNSEG